MVRISCGTGRSTGGDRAGRYDEAIATAERALGLFREVADIAGQGTTLGNLGVALEAVGRYHAAFDAHRAAAALRTVSPLPPEDPAAPTV
ncbi:tetratricopeptide repeat protein [Streptomyces canus]|uniref:tetratricopeptide repeat protein n=1 Tax=Streptomyces canus TaxID=58343 RepID=UPI003864624D